MTLRLLATVALLGFTLNTGDALAGPEDEAKAEYKKAEVAYAIRNFDKAIGHYKRAYELSKAPALLFNIAQAYKAKGDFKQAVGFYETYLRLVQDAPNENDVLRYIGELKTRLKTIDEQEAARQLAESDRQRAETERQRAEAERVRLRAQADAARAQAELARAGGPPRKENPRLKLTGLITAGVGLGVTTAGIVFALQARSDFNAINDTARWTPELDDKLDSAESARTMSYVLSGIGAAAVITGATLYILGRRGSVVEQPATRISVAPTRGGGAVIVGGRF